MLRLIACAGNLFDGMTENSAQHRAGIGWKAECLVQFEGVTVACNGQFYRQGHIEHEEVKGLAVFRKKEIIPIQTMRLARRQGCRLYTLTAKLTNEVRLFF